MRIEDQKSIKGRNLLLFDGVCGLCNGTVRFLIRRDPASRLVYAPLESPLGIEVLESVGLDPTRQRDDGVVLVQAALTQRQSVTTRSDAAARVLGLLGGVWPLAGRLLALVPWPLRDFAYRCIARWRHKLPGVSGVCPLWSPTERQLILGAGD